MNNLFINNKHVLILEFNNQRSWRYNSSLGHKKKIFTPCVLKRVYMFTCIVYNKHKLANQIPYLVKS